MDRPRHLAATLLAVSLTVLAAAACSGGAEQPILNQFFAASRLRDNTSLQNFSTVSFDPQTQGTVSSFSITGVTPEEHKALNVKTLAKALDDARAQDAEYTKRKEQYFSANQEAISKALKAEREKSKLKGKDADVQAAWTSLREEGSRVSRRVADARNKLASESSIVELSFSDQRTPPDYKKYDGELVSKDVTVSANVKLPNGQTTQKTLVVTMQRAVLKADKDIAGRWIITGVKDTSAPAGTKTS